MRVIVSVRMISYSRLLAFLSFVTLSTLQPPFRSVHQFSLPFPDPKLSQSCLATKPILEGSAHYASDYQKTPNVLNLAYREIETQGKLFFCFKFRDRVYVSVIGHLLFQTKEHRGFKLYLVQILFQKMVLKFCFKILGQDIV